MKYTPGLDTIRAFAVIFVIIHHWFPAFAPWMDWGALGVDIFFFLSGFLITYGLLQNIYKPAGAILKNFYYRRTLRIFPLYYGVTLGLIVIGLIGTEWPWYIFYASNEYMYRHGWQALTSHFWSLSVEEQFYLVWPVMLILFRKRILLCLIIIIMASFLIRVYLSYQEKSVILTVTNMYKFAAGGLFAFYIRRIRDASVLWGIAFFVLSCAAYFMIPVARPLSVPLLSFSLFQISLKGWLNFRPTVFVGKISYGLYILHNLVPFFVVKFAPETTPLFLPLCLLILVAVSWASFQYFETPFLRMKERMPVPEFVKTGA